MEEETLRTDFDPNDRVLCPDGGCIGVVGADGLCAVCGKASQTKGSSGASKLSTSPPSTSSDSPADTKAVSDSPREIEGNEFDPDRRELCPDGACVGVIGSNGRCAECGAASAQAPSSASAEGCPSAGPETSASPNHDDNDDGDAQTERAAPAEDARSVGATGDSQDIAERQLCPDGACVGIIGSNGRCKSCGTRAE